jgi:hypothetical protein
MLADFPGTYPANGPIPCPSWRQSAQSERLGVFSKRLRSFPTHRAALRQAGWVAVDGACDKLREVGDPDSKCFLRVILLHLSQSECTLLNAEGLGNESARLVGIVVILILKIHKLRSGRIHTQVVSACLNDKTLCAKSADSGVNSQLVLDTPIVNVNSPGKS